MPGRFPQFTLEDTREGEQRALAERLLRETRAGLGGPWNVMLRSPRMGAALVDLYNHFRRTTPVPQAMVEFAILITARECDAPFEWLVHYPIAVQLGVDAAILADVRVGRRPASMPPLAGAVYEFTVQLLRTHFVTDATFAAASEALGEQGVVDLTALVGTYYAIGGLLNVAEVAVPDGDGPDRLPLKAR